MMLSTGAELFVEALRRENVDTLFAYPGGQAIDLFNALYGEEGIELIVPRHEQGLIHAADGYARSTGKTGVCLVTSGPGATNLVTGIATAHFDSVPIVCFTGQVPTYLIGKDAFQEVDITGITAAISKYSVTVRRREELGPIIRKAFRIARTGRPGVVVVDLPKDIQQALGEAAYPADDVGKAPSASAALQEPLQNALHCLKSSVRPLFLAGGGVRIAQAGPELTRLAEATGIPVVTTIMGKGTLPTDHPLYIGNLGIHGSFAANKAVSECDVLFAIGTRFNDRITGKVSEFASHAVIIHADIDPTSISKNIRTDIPIIADAGETIRALNARPVRPLTVRWREQIAAWKTEHPLPMKANPAGDGGLVTPQAVIQGINTVFEQAVIATDVGQNQLWATQYLALDSQKQLLTSGGLGTMGFGLPAAIGARLGNPDKDAVCICGDGGFQMTVQELATAVVYELPVIICILNNGYLGNVRQWQEMFYGRRYSCTCTRYRKSCPAACASPSPQCPEAVPDFIRLAESYGAKGLLVQREAQIIPALRAAKEEKQCPTVIDFRIRREENVLPIVPAGRPLDEMIL